MRTNVFRLTWLFAILAFSALACQALSGVRDQVSTTRQTVEAAATLVGEGRELLGTAQAITTQVGGHAIIPTAQALATQFSDSGLLETAQALVTEEGPAALGTVQALATQIAQATPAEDIPLIAGDKEMLLQTPFLVSYTAALPFDQALEFYKTQMPLYGWEKGARDGFETESAALLQYEKGARKASISLTSVPTDSKTMVIIVIEP